MTQDDAIKAIESNWPDGSAFFAPLREALTLALAALRAPEGGTVWTPEYIASALAKAYPQAGVIIERGDVIEFAHGDDEPMFQRLTHPAAVEDWNGKLRGRVRGIYKRAPLATPPTPLDHRVDQVVAYMAGALEGRRYEAALAAVNDDDAPTPCPECDDTLMIEVSYNSDPTRSHMIICDYCQAGIDQARDEMQREDIDRDDADSGGR